MTTPSLATPHSPATVDACYAAVSGSSNVAPRSAQIQLSEAIEKALVARQPLAAEAPTGTGKTLSYLIGGLVAARNERKPLVVSTATKALQQQLISQDLPMLFKAGLLLPSEVGLAKGKSNYICKLSAGYALDAIASAEDSAEAYLPDKALRANPAEIKGALAALATGWDGDFDTHDLPISPDTKQAIAVSSDSCTNRKCPHFRECAFFQAKERTQQCKVLVTNHDLLLMDLRLVAEESEPTLSVGDYFLVMDEAHHLPSKAVSAGTYDVHLTQLALSLPKVSGIQQLIRSNSHLEQLARTAELSAASFDRASSSTPLRALMEFLDELEVPTDSKTLRFKKDIVAEEARTRVGACRLPITQLADSLAKLNDAMKSAPEIAALKSVFAELRRRVLDIKPLIDAAKNCFNAFQSKPGYARWLAKTERGMSLHCAPLDAAPVLDTLLWRSSRVRGTVMVSATLRDINGFSRFLSATGAPPTTLTLLLPHTFRYEESTLRVVPMGATPKLAERREFLAELKSKLPAEVSQVEGSLVLFPSWAMLKELTPVLKQKLGERFVKVQGELPPKLLVAAHKKDLDAGVGSLLAGVASLSEGLDLPGKYCEHVLIAALPFSAPSDPVEEELSEILGSRYFSERALPDAMVRLTQMVGRLLRRESDVGRISVFDKRLSTSSYGRKMLNGLPPFTLALV